MNKAICWGVTAFPLADCVRSFYRRLSALASIATRGGVKVRGKVWWRPPALLFVRIREMKSFFLLVVVTLTVTQFVTCYPNFRMS